MTRSAADVGGFFCTQNHQTNKMEERIWNFQSGNRHSQILVMALGAGLAVWGVINLLEGYGSDNPAANAHVR